MRYLNKISTAFCAAALGLMALTSCEGGELYSIGAPDWISEKADSIARDKAEKSKPEVIEGLEEDVYTIGATDYSTGWWAVFTKYYQVPAGVKWQAQFNLNINPNATNTYKNFAMIICNDQDRGAGDYKEYGAIRFDNQPSGNSEWGEYIDRSLVQSTLTFETDTDAGVDKLGGKVTLTVDRSTGGFIITMTNGTVTKTYTQKTDMPNLNTDASNTNIRFFLCPEGSYINFLGSTIEPIGGFTSKEDKQPIGLKLNNVPGKILVGTDLTEALANVTATVSFEQGVTKDVKAADLTFQTIPDMTSLGTKTLVAAYAKTFKGEAAAPVMGYATFSLVDKMYTCIGATDNSTAFWGAHSPYVKVASGETFVSTFTNYTTGANNWNNFVTVLTNSDGTTEYAVVRADNYGWGDGYAACTATTSVTDWATWLAAMNGAKVTVAVTNNGDGTADIEAVMVGTDGNTYTQDYIGINTVDPDNFYMHFTVDGCHLEYDDVIGAEDNTTAFWGAHSPYIKVPAGKTCTRSFINNTTCANNWNNFVTVLTNSDGSTEYAVVRADNYGWGDGYAACTAVTTVTDWATWLSAMAGAKVTVSVTNKGDGTADIKAVMVGNDGVTYTQTYTGINTVDPANFYMHFTVDGCHLIFE